MEDEVFKKCIFIPEKLREFGFNKDFVYEKEILNKEFKIVLRYNKKIEGKIIDQSTKEEYINYRIDAYSGEFVNRIRNEYRSILEEIKEKCTIQKRFAYTQTNRINKLIYNLYQDNPVFLWDDDNAVYRNSLNNKWYGIVMPINKNKLCNEDKNIEVINVKLPPKLINELLKKDGYYKAYHMNKKYWLTISLDDTIKDNDIIELIKISHTYTENINNWIVPINDSFKNNKRIEIDIIKNVKENDFVYIYKDLCILYKYKVIKINEKKIILDLIEEYQKGKYPIEEIKSIKRMPKKLLLLMEE